MRKRAQPPPMFIRICEECGTPFETTDDWRTRCPDEACLVHGWGTPDPCAWDDDDAFKKARENE